MNNTRLTDIRFFTECLDDTVPELAELGRLAAEGRLDDAKGRFAAYVRKTLRPDAYLRGEKERLAPHAAEIAEACRRAMAHTFVSCRVPYTFGETIDWCANPTYNQYCEWPWQLNRHPEWLAMAEEYLLTGDESIPAEWSRQFMSWAIQAQVPENESGFATICWRTIEAGLRMKRWIYAIHAFLHAIDDETLTVFCKSIWEHGWRLRNFCTSHNWLIMEMAGLCQIALFFPFLRESGEWLAYVHKRLEGEIEAQIYPDGMQYELTPGYHEVCVGNYEDVVDMIRLHGSEVPPYLLDGLERMFSVYPKIAAPDFRTPAVNDSGRGNIAEILKDALLYLPDHDEYRYFASERAEGQPPAYQSLLLDYSGMVIFRSSWERDAFWAYMDASPFGKAHQHEDKLNVLLWAYGHELMPEAGTFDYDTSAMRAYVLSTRGHNTARIDGFDQNRRDGYTWHPEDIAKKAEVFFEIGKTRETAEASYDEGYGPDKIPVRHTRKLFFLKNEPGLPPMFVSVDRLEADGAHRAELIWHLCDNPTVIDGRAVHNTFPDSVGVTVASSAGGIQVWRGVREPAFQGWLPKFGIGDVEHNPIPTVLNTFRFEGSCRTVTVLCPYKDGIPPVRCVEASEDAENTDFTVILRDGDRVTVSE